MKRFLMVALLTALIVPLFALDTSKKLEISVSIWDVQSAFVDASDPALKFIQDKFNVTFKPVAMTWDDWNQKVRLWAASGEMPDIVADDFGTRDPAELQKMVKQGVFKALPADLSAYPNIKKFLSQDTVKPLAIGGKFYEVPRAAETATTQGYGSGRTIIVRKDWMKKAGITQNPKNFEEFYALAKALTDKSKGIYGITLADAGQFENLFGAVNQWDWVKDASGKWVPNTTTKNFVTSLQRVSRLVKDGLVDPDFLILKDRVGLEKFAQGKVGMVLYNGGPSHLKQISDRWVNYPDNPPFGDAVAQIPYWPADDGKVYYTPGTGWWSASYFGAKVDDEKLARILAIYDFLFSPEGMTFNIYGLEGKDYTKTGDKITITREKDDKGNLVAIGKKYPSIQYMFSSLANWSADLTMWKKDEANYAAYGKGPLEVAMESHDWRMKNAVAAPINWKITFLTSVPGLHKFSDVLPGTIAYTDAVKVVMQGGDVAGAWAKVLEGYKAQGLDQIITDVNNAIK